MFKNLPSVLLVFALTACSPSAASIGTAIAQTQAAIPTATVLPAPTFAPTPPYSAELKLRLRSFFEKGSHAAAIAKQGATYVSMREAVGDVRGAYDLVASAWPAGVADLGLIDAGLAVLGWELASDLWYLKLNGSPENGNGQVTDGNWPAADYPDKPPGPQNNYEGFIAYAGSELVVLQAPAGNKYLPFDENIQILLGKGNDYFDSCQAKLLTILQ